MTCTLCTRDIHDEARTLCGLCAGRLRQRLEDIPALHAEASNCLLPQKAGQGTNTGEPTLGINLNALDYASGKAILDCLHGWEQVIREDRRLTPPALVPHAGSVDAEVAATVRFHLAHLDWTLTQPFADDMAKEVAAIHSAGLAATRQHLDHIRRIPCPAEVEDGTPCDGVVPVFMDDLTATVRCRRCRNTWTVARLVAVAMSDDNGREVWLDADGIASWTGITARHVRRYAAEFNVPKRGQLYELRSFLRAKDSRHAEAV